MVLNQLEIDGFRNYGRQTVDFSPDTNVIIGQNGQGKTNLLEAVYYLSGAKSFRTRFDRELVGFDREFARIRAGIFSENREQSIDITLRRGRRKDILLNGTRLKTSGELGGKLMTVLFSPDDLSIVREGAAARRRLMDMAICQLRPKYAAWLSEFNRLYEHKLRILKDHREKPALLDTLDDFNLRLAQVGAEMIRYRAAFVNKLEQYANAVHREFSGGRESLSIRYRTVKTVQDPLDKAPVLFSALTQHQQGLRQAEIDSGLCLSGVHKDDMEITISGVSARSFASQGQTRTAALSIKLAERDIFFDDRGEYPLLLLDDVLSELDASRQDFVLNRIGNGQVFITCCESGRIADRTGGKIFTVEKGRVS